MKCIRCLIDDFAYFNFITIRDSKDLDEKVHKRIMGCRI